MPQDGHRNLNFTIPQLADWYVQQNLPFLNDGVEFWWNDEGETAFFTYALWNAAQEAQATAVRPAARTFTLNRAFPPGMQRGGPAGHGPHSADVTVDVLRGGVGFSHRGDKPYARPEMSDRFDRYPSETKGSARADRAAGSARNQDVARQRKEEAHCVAAARSAREGATIVHQPPWGRSSACSAADLSVVTDSHDYHVDAGKHQLSDYELRKEGDEGGGDGVGNGGVGFI
jgi:hypothetical protein